MIRVACNTNQVFILSLGSLQKCLSGVKHQVKDTTKDSSHGTPILTTLDLEGWPYVSLHFALEHRGLCSHKGPILAQFKKRKMPAIAQAQPSLCPHTLAFCMTPATHVQATLQGAQPFSFPASSPSPPVIHTTSEPLRARLTLSCLHAMLLLPLSPPLPVFHWRMGARLHLSPQAPPACWARP